MKKTIFNTNKDKNNDNNLEQNQDIIKEEPKNEETGNEQTTITLSKAPINNMEYKNQIAKEVKHD